MQTIQTQKKKKDNILFLTKQNYKLPSIIKDSTETGSIQHASAFCSQSNWFGDQHLYSYMKRDTCSNWCVYNFHKPSNCTFTEETVQFQVKQSRNLSSRVKIPQKPTDPPYNKSHKRKVDRSANLTASDDSDPRRRNGGQIRGGSCGGFARFSVTEVETRTWIWGKFVVQVLGIFFFFFNQIERKFERELWFCLLDFINYFLKIIYI